jgi:hypothetical protein
MVAIDNEVTTKQMAVKPFDYDGSVVDAWPGKN